MLENPLVWPNKFVFMNQKGEDRIETFSGPDISHMIERISPQVSFTYIFIEGIPK